MIGRINSNNEYYRALSKDMVGGAKKPALNLRGAQSFFFTRLQYQSGDWNTDQRMPSNILNSIVEYTTVPIDEKENVISLSSSKLFEAPFCYLSGHKLVQFTGEEKSIFEKYVERGGFVFVDDCNHDIDGLFAKSFERQMDEIFPGELKKIPNDHDLYKIFFEFEKGPPTTSVELNGWGDDLVHDYLKAIVIDGQIRVLYSNKDYGCEWDYDHRNKRWMAIDNTRFGINIVMYSMLS